MVPKAFFWRRIHSLTGLGLVIYLFQHLLVNSQAALWLGDDGKGFVNAVNGIHELPYLLVIEILVLAIPILIHAVWGIQYLRTGVFNSFSTDGATPSLPEYPRNHAYTWQRVTSWILLFAILFHVVHMRFLRYPDSAQVGGQKLFTMPVAFDEGLYTLSARLDFQLYDKAQIAQLDTKTSAEALFDFWELRQEVDGQELIKEQRAYQLQQFTDKVQAYPLAEGEVLTVANDFGTAELLMLRDVFKSPLMMVLYTLLVLSATFHGFNGLWTFLISWGVTLTPRSQFLARRLSNFLMILVAFFGLAAIWGTYWVNLRY